MRPSALSSESQRQTSKCGRCCNCIRQQAETQRLRLLRGHRRSSRRTRAEAQLFGSVGIDVTLDQLAEPAAQLDGPAALARAEAAQARIADYDAEISRYICKGSVLSEGVSRKELIPKSPWLLTAGFLLIDNGAQ